MKRKYIGFEPTLYRRLKPEYRFVENGDPMGMVFIEIYTDKRYGIKAELVFNETITQYMLTKIPKKVREKFVEKLRERIKENKPVDTSKWVKPDEESIRRELVKRLIMQEILQEREFHLPIPSSQLIENRAKAELCYSILHSNSPLNPQSLTSFGMVDIIETIITEMRGTESKVIKERYKNIMKDDRPVEIRREEFKRWRENSTKNMIVLNSTLIKGKGNS